MKKTNYDILLKSLNEGAKSITVHGVTHILKDCFDRIPGEMDPRTEYASTLTREILEKNETDIHPELLNNIEKLCGPKDPENYDKVEFMRYTFGWKSTDLSTEVHTSKVTLKNDDNSEFTAYIYDSNCADKNRPCMVFFHGGGFVAGDIETVENQCKLLAEKSKGVVISVDYPLAPEKKHPHGFNACFKTLLWAHENAESLGIANDRIGVAGDSAGGNLALACTIKDLEQKRNTISYQALIYPFLNRAFDKEGKLYFWDKTDYYNPSGNAIIKEQSALLGGSTNQNNEWVVPSDIDYMDKYVCPIVSSCVGMPKTLMMVAEYDFLRAECDYYCKKLKDAGVLLRAIRYGGIFHGTFDRLGYAPQVEDIIDEMATLMIQS